MRELRAYLAGTSSLAEAVVKSKTETRRYAKRQMTWLRRYMAGLGVVPGPSLSHRGYSGERRQLDS